MLKKPVFILVMVLLFAFFVTGCAMEDVPTDTSSTAETSDNNSQQVNKISKDEGINVNLNDTMEFPDLGELVIKKAEYTDKVLPSNPDMFYSYYESKASDKEYFHLVGTFKNTSEDDIYFSIVDDPINFELVYKDKYKYDGFTVIEDDGGGDFNISEFVEPLTSATMHVLIEVPKEIEDSGETVKVVISANGTNYNLLFKP